MTPNTTVYLFATPFDISNEYVIKADSDSAAWGIVSSYPSVVKTNCYWQRSEDFVFRCDGNINDLLVYNYCVYINNGKRNYAFITSMQYVNDMMTWIYLTVDPWMNFAGQYTFNPSPMVRCHPTFDALTDNGGNFFNEPYSLQKHKVSGYSGGGFDQYDRNVHLMTLISAQAFSGFTSHLHVAGIGQLIQTGASTDLESWFDRQTAYMTGCGTSYQPNTSVIDIASAARVISEFAIQGISQYLLAAYYVPLYFRQSGNTGYDLQILATGDMTVVLPAPTWSGFAFWNKIKYSPQYNGIYVNITGNTREIPTTVYSPVKLAGDNLTFKIAVDQSINGCAIIRPDQGDIINGESNANYAVASKNWDTISIAGYGVNRLRQSQDELTETMQSINNLISAGTAIGSLFANPISGLAGLARAAASEYDTRESARIREQVTARSGGVRIGSNAGNMSSYNMAAPLVRIERWYPSDVDTANLDKMFSTYGYMQGGTIQDILFHMPVWTYYQTQAASIEGPTVPQRYLNQIIDRFNRGIFVFTDQTKYKKFNLWSSNHL